MGMMLVRTPGHRRDVSLRPAATAMAFLGESRPHEAVAVPGVALGDGDVLVAVELSTICGCALRALRRATPGGPVVLGHESVGRVIAIGDGGACTSAGVVLRIGDRVVWSATASCGVCSGCHVGGHCQTPRRYGQSRIGQDGDLTGAFASHVQVRAGTAVLAVPESLPAAALAPASCAGARAWAAVALAGAQRDLDGARVRIHGAGLVGLTACALLVEFGAVVTMVDADQRRAARGAEFGATGLDEVVDIEIDTTGTALSAAMGHVGVGGLVILAGDDQDTEPSEIDSDALRRRRLTVAGVGEPTPADFAGAVDFLTGRGRGYPFAETVGAVAALSGLDDAMIQAQAKGAPLRVGVIPRR